MKWSMLILGLLFFPLLTNATERKLTAEYNAVTREVKIQIQDTEESRNACDYYVQSFEYFPEQKSLQMRLAEEPCFTPVMGRKKAILRWNLPRSLHANSLCVTADAVQLASLQFESEKVIVTQICN